METSKIQQSYGVKMFTKIDKKPAKVETTNRAKIDPKDLKKGDKKFQINHVGLKKYPEHPEKFEIHDIF